MSALHYSPAASGATPPRVLRRRFLLVGIALLAVLGPLLGVSYLGNTGTSVATVTGSSPNLVYPVSSTDPAFPSAVTTLANGSATSAAGKLPGWSPAANTPGSVTTPGDLALVDATSGNVVFNVYITNLAALGQDYQSFALPINVYKCTSSCTATTAWTAVSGAASSLLSSQPNFSIDLPAGSYYDVAIDAGGSYYCVSTSASGGSLSPTFYFSAQAL